MLVYFLNAIKLSLFMNLVSAKPDDLNSISRKLILLLEFFHLFLHLGFRIYTLPSDVLYLLYYDMFGNYRVCSVVLLLLSKQVWILPPTLHSLEVPVIQGPRDPHLA